MLYSTTLLHVFYLYVPTICSIWVQFYSTCTEVVFDMTWCFHKQCMGWSEPDLTLEQWTSYLTCACYQTKSVINIQPCSLHSLPVKKKLTGMEKGRQHQHMAILSTKDKTMVYLYVLNRLAVLLEWIYNTNGSRQCRQAFKNGKPLLVESHTHFSFFTSMTQ